KFVRTKDGESAGERRVQTIFRSHHRMAEAICCRRKFYRDVRLFLPAKESEIRLIDEDVRVLLNMRKNAINRLLTGDSGQEVVNHTPLVMKTHLPLCLFKQLLRVVEQGGIARQRRKNLRDSV